MGSLDYEAALLAMEAEKWNRLSLQDKVAALQSVENEMAKRTHRIPCEIEARPVANQGKGVMLGAYDPQSRRILINSSQLEYNSEFGRDYKNAFNTILHEGRHAYQDQAVLGYATHSDWREVEKWKENMKPENYITFSQNPRAYYDQPIERDARSFAEKMSEKMLQERALLQEKVRQEKREKLKGQYEKENSGTKGHNLKEQSMFQKKAEAQARRRR